MTRWLPAACFALLGAAVSGQRDLVELDVVALDRDDNPVTDLRQEDFKIKEDGRLVELKTFSRVTALGTTQPDDSRVVTLLMGDIGVPITGTAAMQAIAQVMLSPSAFGANVFVPVAEAIWREAGRYYLLGYWPSAGRRDLHSIDVGVARKGVHVHARQRR